jgi:hypothetical protein
MEVMTRDQREYELTAMLLENRKALYATYATAIGKQPEPWLTDAQMISDVLRKEFNSKSSQASDSKRVMGFGSARNS